MSIVVSKHDGMRYMYCRPATPVVETIERQIHEICEESVKNITKCFILAMECSMCWLWWGRYTEKISRNREMWKAESVVGSGDFFINPLTAGFSFLLALCVPPFKHDKDKMWHQSAIFENRWTPFCQIWIIFTHLKLLIASARHNFKWVKIQIE